MKNLINFDRVALSVFVGVVCSYGLLLSKLYMPHYHALTNNTFKFLTSSIKSWYTMMAIGYNPEGAYLDMFINAAIIAGIVYCGFTLIRLAIVASKHLGGGLSKNKSTSTTKAIPMPESN